MKHFLLAALLSTFAFSAQAEFQPLSKSTTSWDGQDIVYPQGEEEVTAIKLTLPAGEQLPFHCHPYSTVGIVSAGEIEVEKLNGEKKKFAAGDTIVEVANTWHRGTNTSKETAELVGFYIGIKDKPNTVMMDEKNKDLCK